MIKTKLQQMDQLIIGESLQEVRLDPDLSFGLRKLEKSVADFVARHEALLEINAEDDNLRVTILCLYL